MTAPGLRGALVRVPGGAGPVAIALREGGWATAVVGPARTDEQLWDAVADALALPGWFGRNLDALEEVLADLEVPTALVLTGWTAYARARPDRWVRLLEVLQAAAERDGPALRVVLSD